jgi:hypothetical protein
MKILKFALAAVACAQPVVACDFCSIYSATETRAGKGFYAGVAEQFTHFSTALDEGHEVSGNGQYLDSSITQLVLGYNVTHRFGVQVNAPWIYRAFRRPEGFATDRGTETGVGDLSLIGRYVVHRQLTQDDSTIWNIFAGVKFPTGNAHRLREELNEVEVPGAPESGIHGHDLALGSGSYDGVVGTSAYVRHRRFFFSGEVQYTIRSEGALDYQFANALTWSGGPGALLILREDLTLSLQANVSGETKGRDTFQGARAEDTGLTAVYLGPELLLTWQERLSAELGLDVPLAIDNTAFQIVPDYRVRVAFTWHF